MPDRAFPPETTEGWFAFHQVLTWNRPALRAMSADSRTAMRSSAERTLTELATPAAGGWTAVVPLIGSRGDVMLVHFR
ncbi:MAG: hypothetical protein ABJE47_05635, partial [bacterium]